MGKAVKRYLAVASERYLPRFIPTTSRQMYTGKNLLTPVFYKILPLIHSIHRCYDDYKSFDINRQTQRSKACNSL